MEHADAAQVAALVGALGALLVTLPRGRAAPLAGFTLLGLAIAGFGWSLVGDDDVKLLFTEPTGLALVGIGALGAIAIAVPLARYPSAVPIALLAAAPFRIPVELGDEEAFLLLPLYLVLAACVLAFAYGTIRGRRTPPPPLLLALPLAVFVAFSAVSFLWTHDERPGGIALAFFVFPFVAGFGIVARTPIAPWLPRALACTVVALASLFAAIGLWQAETRTLFYARDVEVANAYTSFFRVTSLFKDPSLYGRYLVISISVLLVALWFRRSRTIEWVVLGTLVAFLFAGLYFSYSQSSFVALFVVTFAVAVLGAGRRLRVLLIVSAVIASLAAAGFAAQSVQGRSVKDVTSSRSRLITITLDAFETRPVAGVGIGGQPRASVAESGSGSVRRSASHTTPLTVLAELGVIGFVLYLWTLAAAGWAVHVATKRAGALGVGLAAVLLVLFVHSLLYAGFFEDPLTWGVFGMTAAVLVSAPATGRVAFGVERDLSGTPGLLAHLKIGRLAGRFSMPRALKLILLVVAVLVAILAGVMAAIWLSSRDKPEGALDTALSGVTVTTPTTPKPSKAPKPEQTSDKLCWRSFGGDPQRSLSRPDIKLGPPVRKYRWTRVLNGYMEYPPSYCDGVLYVNTFRGTTYAIDAETGKVRWRRQVGGTKPSTPAIDGPRLIVSSQDGTVTAFDRAKGTLLWQLQTTGKVESSPVIVGGIAYFGSTDGRLFAVSSATGRVRWAYNTGGRINSSPSVYGRRVCISTYAGSVLCLNRFTGQRRWITYVRRDAFRWESFYASPSTDGQRVYTVARSGRVVALDARNGDTAWTARVGGLGYTTPAVANGRVFVGGFDGRLRAFRSTTGSELWSTWVGGKILGAPVVVGNLVFFSSLSGRTYAVRATDGKVVWRLSMGRYSPVIATEKTYYFALNGRLLAFEGRNEGS